MYVRVLGPVAAGPDPDALVEPSGSVAAATLAAIALARGRVVDVDGLADQVWDDPPEHPRNALQAAVSRLRRAFGPHTIESSGGGYRLGAGVVVDEYLVRQGLASARAALEADRFDEAARAAGRAFDLFVGEPLSGLEPSAAISARAALDELRLALVLLLADSLVRDGRPEEAVHVLRGEIARRPLVEPLHERLMRALAASGRGAEALAAYDVWRRCVVDELGCDPSPGVVHLFEDLLAGRDVGPSPSKGRGPSPVRVVLPPSRALPIGRDDDVAELVRLLAVSRVMTLVGLGGIGKTTLALATARQCAQQGGSDVVWVTAADATTADEVLGAISRAWGGDGSPDGAGAVVRSELAGRAGLLVLDNCEDVPVAAVLDELLDDVDGLAVLATSRAPIGVRDEYVVRVSGLAASDAARLFEIRARQVGALELDGAIVERLVDAVDRSPLGVELVAGRLAAESARSVLAELEARPGRSPLDAVVDWAARRLSPEAGSLLSYLADLPDGVGPGLARYLVGDAAPSALLELVQSGLVHRRDRGRTFWTSPEMVRQHVRTSEAAGRRVRAGVVCGYYAALHAESFRGYLPRAGHVDALDERGNVAAALAHTRPEPDDEARLLLLMMAADHESGVSDSSVADRAEALTALVDDRLRPWLRAIQARRLQRENRPADALAVCDEVCAAAVEAQDPALAAVTHYVAVHVLVAQGRNEAALDRTRLGLAAAEEATDPAGDAHVVAPQLLIGGRRLLAGTMNLAGASPDAVAAAYDDALVRAREIGRPGLVLTDLCVWAAFQGMDVLAASAAEELRAVTPAYRHYTLAHADVADAVVAWRRRDARGVVGHARTALDRFRGSGDVRWMGECLWLLAEAALLMDDEAAAARLLGARAAVDPGDDVDPRADELAARLRSSLGARWALHEREGRLLSIDEAVALVAA